MNNPYNPYNLEQEIKRLENEEKRLTLQVQAVGVELKMLRERR